MANCFEALMGSLFLDGGIEVADRVFGETLFKDEEDLAKVWVNYPRHPLQEQEPTGDRQWIPSFELLQVFAQRLIERFVLNGILIFFLIFLMFLCYRN